MKWQLHLWMKTTPDCTCLLSESRFPQALHSKLWNDISQIACCLGNAARHHRMGLEAWQPMEIQRAYAIKHEASFVTARSAGWMSFNITIKRLPGWLGVFTTWDDTSVPIFTKPLDEGCGVHTCIQQHNIQYTYDVKVKKKNIFYKTLTDIQAVAQRKKQLCWKRCGIVLAKRSGQEVETWERENNGHGHLYFTCEKATLAIIHTTVEGCNRQSKFPCFKQRLGSPRGPCSSGGKHG